MKNFFTFLTICFCSFSAFSQTVYSESDLDGGLPVDWTADTDWQIGSAAALGSQYFPIPGVTGGNVAAFNDDDLGNGHVGGGAITTSAIDLTDAEGQVFLIFDSYFLNGDYGGLDETARVSVSTDMGATYTMVEDLAGDQTGFESIAINISSYIGETIMVQFAYDDGATWNYGWAIDNVSISSLPAREIELVAVTGERFFNIGTDKEITGTVKNNGGDVITSFDVTWSDGTNDFTQTIEGVSIAPFATAEFTHPDMLSIAEAVAYEYTVTVSMPNGEMDGNPDNNSGESYASGLAFNPTKAVVVEEATGTWCPWCPRGTVGMEYMEDTYPETFIGIAVHNGDPMVVTEYDSNLGVGGYPSSHVDRFVLDTDPAAANLEALHNARLTDVTPVAVDQNITYDADTRTIEVEVTANFAAAAWGDYRINLVITEDGVTGTGSGYAQANNYAGGGQGPMGGYENLPSTVPADQMVYDHVARAILGGFEGTADVISDAVLANDVYTQSYTYVLPADYDESLVNVIAMVLDGESGSIMNAQKQHLSDFFVGTNDVYRNDLAKVYPNPFSDEALVELNMETASDVSLRVINSVGQVMVATNYGSLSGKNVLPIDGTNLSNGVYMIHITMGDVLITKRVTLSK